MDFIYTFANAALITSQTKESERALAITNTCIFSSPWLGTCICYVHANIGKKRSTMLKAKITSSVHHAYGFALRWWRHSSFCLVYLNDNYRYFQCISSYFF